jgi:hypothetical protein
MHRNPLLALPLLALCCAALPAQHANYAGIQVSATGVSPSTNITGSYPPCGLAFSCTPMPLAAQNGDTVRFFVMTTFNGLVVLAGTLDPTGFCLPTGVPTIVNNLVLSPAAMSTLFIGVATVPDNGRCNGGATPSTVLLTIPQGLHGTLGLQALASSPLTSGNGYALSNAVSITF